MTLGIDIDNTMINSNELANKCAHEFDPSIEDYHKIPASKYREFLNKYLEYIEKNAKPKDNLKEVFDYFKENNIKIVIITARNKEDAYNTEIITIDYMKKNNIPYDNIVFNSQNKGIDAKKYNVDLFIDDKEFNLDSVNKEGIPVLKFADGDRSKYKSVSSWLEIKDIVRGILDERNVKC